MYTHPALKVNKIRYYICELKYIASPLVFEPFWTRFLIVGCEVEANFSAPPPPILQILVTYILGGSFKCHRLSENVQNVYELLEIIVSAHIEIK